LRPRRFAGRIALVVVVSALAGGCGMVAERRLRGEWETEATPKRTLNLFADGTYSLRLSGKGLGFVSDVLGPEKGAWHVGDNALVLVRHDEGGAEETRRWPINELRPTEAVLAGERWIRVARKG